LPPNKFLVVSAVTGTEDAKSAVVVSCAKICPTLKIIINRNVHANIELHGC